MAGANFPNSTHFKHWLFSPEVVSALRAEANRKAFGQLPSSATAESGPVPLSIAEEALLRRHSELKILEVCRKLSYREEVQATSVVYFKRFFLYNPITEFDLTAIMLTCIYLACKSEEAHVSIDDFVRPLKVAPSLVLGHELQVLEGIKFHLMVFLPIKPLHGFLVDLLDQVTVANTSSTILLSAIQRLKSEDVLRTKVHDRAVEIVMGVLTTDACLLFPPGPIALAALLRAAREHGIDLSDYIALRFPQAPSSITVPSPSMAKVIERIQPFLDEGLMPPPNTEEVRRIDRQLRFCRNPELIEKQKKQQSEEKERRRQLKLQLRAEKEKEELAKLTGTASGSSDASSEFVIRSVKRRK